jgi:hypothetical protein
MTTAVQDSSKICVFALLSKAAACAAVQNTFTAAVYSLLECSRSAQLRECSLWLNLQKAFFAEKATNKIERIAELCLCSHSGRESAACFDARIQLQS